MVSHIRRLASLFIILWFFFTGAIPVGAQMTASARLTTPDITKFPQLSAYLVVYDGKGTFVRNLSLSQLTIIEDGARLSASELTELKPGAQFVVALNPGRSFAIRDSLGVSRYEVLLDALRAWLAAPRRSDQDDLSLVNPEAPEVAHSTVPLPLQSNLEAYQVNARTIVPDLDSLNRAIELASDPTPREGMGRGILWITSPPEGEMEVGLQSLAAMAVQNGIQIHIWLVTSPELFASPVVQSLQELANQTQGQLVLFSGVEVLPDPDLYLENLRNVYRLGYVSKANSSGDHRVEVEAHLDGETVRSSSVTFQLVVQPPSPIFLSPPVKIHRANIAASEEEAFILAPLDQTLEILVEFPDGYQRSILTTTLFVDGAVAGVNTAAPFTRFTWDLRGYQTSAEHRLRVEVADSLGLRGSTVEVPVYVSVESPTQGMLVSLSKHRPLLVGVGILFAVIVVALAFIMGGRLRPKIAGRKSEPVTRKLVPKRVISPKSAERQNHEETTASVQADRHLPHWANRLPWAQRRSSLKPVAYLNRIYDLEESPITTPPLPLVMDEITIGTDSTLSTLVIPDPSLERLHSCLRHEHNTYRLLDAGSVAGTWINYLPVPQEGVILEHGDLVHFGKIGYRYTLRQPGRIHKPVVKVEDSSL